MADDHPMAKHAGVLKDLAEGRTEPDDWVAWWNEHAAELESESCPPGWLLGLKPKGFQSGNRFDPVLASQGGACHILKSLGIPFEPSLRYSQAWQEELQRFIAAEKARKAGRKKKYAPLIETVTIHFPNFGKFLKRKAADIEEMEPPASPEKLAAAEVLLQRTVAAAERIGVFHCAIGLEE